MTDKNGRITYDTCHTLNRQIQLPDVQITCDQASHIYVPLRGHPHTLAVFDLEDRPIGWIKCETLGYNSVDEWMKATKWVDGGY